MQGRDKCGHLKEKLMHSIICGPKDRTLFAQNLMDCDAELCSTYRHQCSKTEIMLTIGVECSHLLDLGDDLASQPRLDCVRLHQA